MLYNFLILFRLLGFPSFTHRWAILKEILKDGLVVKSLSFKRWSARADALKTLLKPMPEITELLKKMSENVDEQPICHQEANGVARKLQKPEDVFF